MSRTSEPLTLAPVVWQRRGSYEGARALMEAAITEDQIMGSDGDLTGVNVMTMHKSKGKEF